MSAAATLLAAALAAHPKAPPEERGVALGLFSQDDRYDYTPLLREIAAHGATHVSVVWVWWQEDIRDVRIRRHPVWSASPRQVKRTVEAARELGLRVTLFPIVRLQTDDPQQWRGRLAPRDEDAWWDSYSEYILTAAQLAERGGATRLSVGSELLTREPMRARWIELIERVRSRHPDLELLYSANWDHFKEVAFWDQVDVVGLTAYWELTRTPDPSVDELRRAWLPIIDELSGWSDALGRPFVFTEVGYPSQDGGAAWPWNETRKAEIDLVEQARAYEAFVSAWASQPRLSGVYFWNWFGFGGPEDDDYTPRGKPAADIMKTWFRSGGERPAGSLPP